MKIVCCTCYSVSETLLWQGLWPATPVEPTLAFTTKLLEFPLALVMECQVSIFDLVKALGFTTNPLIKVCYDLKLRRHTWFRYTIFPERQRCSLFLMNLQISFG